MHMHEIEFKQELAYLAAGLALRIHDTVVAKKLVNNWLERGVYFDEFLNIVDCEPGRIEDASAALSRLLPKFGCSFPSRDEAFWQIIDYHTARISKQLCEPYEGLRAIIKEVYCQYNFPETEKHLGDSLGIERLIGTYWNIDDILARCAGVGVNAEDQRMIDDLKREILEEAQDWQLRRSTNNLFPSDHG